MLLLGEKLCRKEKASSGHDDLPPCPFPFETHEQLFSTAQKMIEARSCSRIRLQPNPLDPAAWIDHWRACVARSSVELYFVDRCRKANLNHLEVEILVTITLEKLGFIFERADSCQQLLKTLGLTGPEIIPAMRLLDPDQNLQRSALIACANPDDARCDHTFVVDPILLDAVLLEQARPWAHAIESEDDLFQDLSQLSKLFEAVVDLNVRRNFTRGIEGERFKFTRRITQRIEQVLEILCQHSDWRLSQLLASGNGFSEEQFRVVLALLAKDLNQIPPGHELFSGAGLSVAAGITKLDHNKMIELLGADSKLMRDGWIRSIGSKTQARFDSPAQLLALEYELSDKVLTMLKLRRSQDGLTRSGQLYHPQTSFDQLALAPEVRECILFAVAQITQSSTIFGKWGLDQTIHYGKGVTMIFSGPPGVGKTACAEALAHKLDRPLLVANYARIQNAYIGQTEKNITRIFHEAASHDAVLFWDEADAMFHDRGRASKQWEVREVNVLLYELERFEGVCVLATNRIGALDKAFARRISLKCSFEKPDKTLREAIWTRLLPESLPLADDVDIRLLAQADLTGGEIKNVILNACRSAVTHNNGTMVSTEDFKKALDHERQGTWTGPDKKLGFVSSS